VNSLLTPLAVLGLIFFGLLIVLIAILFFQQASGAARLLRSSRMNVRFEWGSKPLDSPAPRLDPDEDPPALEKGPTAESDTPGGWGFDSP
jgi:hypothetical protein